MEDAKELKAWLARQGCQQYYSRFVEQGITYDLLPELDTEALRELGVTKLGDRLRLEISISSLKADHLAGKVSLDELYDLLNLHLNSTPSADISRLESLANESATLLAPQPSNTSLGDANKTVTFIMQDGLVKKVNITGCFNALLIKRKVLKKFGIKLKEANYDTYIHGKDMVLSRLYDVELVTICYSPDRIEKHRIMLCPKEEEPSETAQELSKRISQKHGKLLQPELSQYHIPARSGPLMRNFFGQRPPSELISSNLAEYFPEARQKELEATVRNLVRYSVRISKRFNFPFHSNASSNASFGNPRMSILSNNTVRTPSVLSSEVARRHASRTIGDVMVNNITSIEEVVDQHSKPPSIVSGGTDDKARRRLSVATSFADQSNRYLRIELYDIDSDDEDDDFIDEYGTYTSGELDSHYDEKTHPHRKWLQGARIGAGSFGTVYLGMDPFTGELMAVKQVLLPGDNSLETQRLMIEALEREMTLLKELNHENIVRYLGSLTDEHFLNIFLEYVPGGSVQSMLNSYGPFEEPLIRNFIRQVLIGLAYLHGEDIIHRDIKGANILIDIKGTVKISDFGISKKVGVDFDDEERKGRRASLQGSVYWMAPEVVKQTAYTKKADIWLVGCLIVEMFTGKHPFPNFSQMQAIFKIGTHITPQIPEWCTMEAKDFLGKAFELEYEKRPSAVEMLAEPFLNPLIMSKK